MQRAGAAGIVSVVRSLPAPRLRPLIGPTLDDSVPMDSGPALVIFDCDGVLVDSELLGNRVLAAVAGECGVTVDPHEALTLFRGCKMADCVAVLGDRLGRPLPDDFVATVRARTAAAFRAELRPVEGVVDALARIAASVCVASSGPREKIELALSVTGLFPRFTGRIFSAYEVESWKPAPDLFLHAAATLGVPPAACAVVEDSALGVRAGVAAGMTVIAYAPAAQDAAELADLGASVIRHMHELPARLNALAADAVT
jgi:HAD superfamily hydrolase (TIGR01509 family)